MNRKHFAIVLAAVLLIGCIAVGVAASDAVAVIGNRNYGTLQAAVDAYTDASTAIRLTADTDEAVTITKDVYLDLNGFDVTGAVTVSGGTLYCMDSQTDDYTIRDAAGYGKLLSVSGAVAGVPAGAECAEDGYLMVTEENAYSFHRVNLQIESMSLRTENVGIYYNSHFAGDEKVAENVKHFGIALSIDGIPTEENLIYKCGRSVFTGFTAGSNNTGTSTLLKNVMKSENTQATNESNSQLPIYGRAYILTNDGAYVFGDPVSRSLAEQVTLAASDANWGSYTKAQKDAALSMYRQYKDIMRHWKVANIESALCLDGNDPLSPSKEGSLKVLAVTSSFGLNTTQLLYDVAVAEGYAPENVTVARLYTSGCTLQKHIQYAPDKPVYQYTKISGDPAIVSEYGGEVGKMKTIKTEGNATLLDGLLDEEWDIIFMQQGARVASIETSYVDANGDDYIDQLRAIMDPYVEAHCPNARFVWNMLWAYDEGSPQYPYNTTFNSDQMAMYRGSVDSTMKYVVPRSDYDRIIPTGTAIQNARSSYFGETMSRDTYHLNNLGGTIAAYGLFAVITGQEITEINLDIVSASNKNGIGGAAKINEPFTEKQKAVIMESVNNSLKNPFAVTESQYPPIDYSSYTYTENLRFIGDTEYAVCPACKAEVKWTEIKTDASRAPTDTTLFGTPLPSGHYHFYLSSDVTYTGSSNPFLYINASSGGQRIVCLHLNSHNLTATNYTAATIGANGILNIMGQGTVSGNGPSTDRASTIVVNSSATNVSGFGTVRLYSGTYIQPEGNERLAPVSTGRQGGLLEIYEDVTIEGITNSLWVNTSNNNNDSAKNLLETVNIYGGTFAKSVYCSPSKIVTSKSNLNVYGGTFNGGIALDSNTVASLSGAPVIKGAGLVLPTGVTVTLGELTAGAKIAVNATGAFTAANTKAAQYLQYFSPAVSGKQITVSSNILTCQTASDYTKNLEFEEGTTTALCPACGVEKEWIEVNKDNLNDHVTAGYFGATLANGTYHFYLSSDVTFTAANASNSFIHIPAGKKNVCLHLNGNDLTATNCAVSIMAGNAKLNVMGTGTVSGNHSHSQTFRGSTFVLNSGTTSSDPGTLRLYSGTYVQPTANTQLAPVSTSFQGGLLEIYKDATITGNPGTYSIALHTGNNKSDKTAKYDEVVNIYGGTFNRPIHTEVFTNSSIHNTVLNIYGGTFNDGIEIDSHTSLTLSGAPVIKGAGLVLPSGVTATLVELTAGASIRVDANGAFTAANPLAADYVQYFEAVRSGYGISESGGVLSCSAS